ncbi:hypothetical protein JZ751_026999 [Albula glossodonta]|uniref:C2H2-type domain-containing protein n=1 Tax=Albula glossodonta TaxID=121402 RepID=A0A8T2MWY9_9TELE|nr:hypothetical protein JZ751_026999 [Albula glossodonta]
MAEQPFCITQPSLSCSDSSCFPSQDTPGQSQSYRLPAASELSPHFFQHPNLSPEQPYQVGFELSKLASPWLSSPPVWASQSMGGAMETNESSSSTLQRLDSFTHAFANRNLCMFTSSSPSLSAPLPSCVTTPTDSALCQLLSQKPLLHQGMVPMQTQPLGAQQKCPETESQPMRRYDQAHSRQSVNVQDSMQPEYSYGQQQDPYDLQQELPYYHLHPHPNGSTAHTMANAHAGPSALHNADMVLPAPTRMPTLPHSTPAQSLPSLPSPHGQICTMQPFQQSSPVDPPHTIPQNHCFYLQPELQHSQPSHRQNRRTSSQPQAEPAERPAQPQAEPQNVQPSHRLSHQQSSYHMQQQVHMQTEPLPFYRSDSTHLSPTLLSPTHFSQTEQSPTPCQPHPLSVAATPSPCDQGQRSDLEFHPGGQLQPSSTSPSQWPQVQLQVHSVDPPSPSHSVTPRRPREEGLSRLLCSICQKEFKSLPALNGHMRSHGGGVTPKTVRPRETAGISFIRMLVTCCYSSHTHTYTHTHLSLC